MSETHSTQIREPYACKHSSASILWLVLLALAHRPTRTLLVVELAVAVIVAGAIILPFQPSFAAILAVGVIPLIAYP